MTILVTGGTGQLATALAVFGATAIGRPAFDFDRPETIDALFEHPPALLINAAAWTAVDAAEREPEAAARANRDGPARLAERCRALDIPLIHVSTDYVFDGTKGAPYVETDPVSPASVYGRTKLEGEQAILAAGGRAVIVRTSWVYAATGKNFVRTMLTLGRTRDHLRVVADQRGCPTAAPDLAHTLLGIAAAIETGWRDDFAGVFHAAGDGDTTWHAFAEAIFDEAARHGAKRPSVEPITTADYPTPARRPADSRLDCAKLARVFGLRLPPWRDSLGPIVGQLVADLGPRPDAAA